MLRLWAWCYLPIFYKGYKRQRGEFEEGRGGLRLNQSLRFPSPLLKPDVPISGIRVSGWIHREAHGDGA